MSDLISRSELLESFRKSYCGHLGMENSDRMMTFRSICRIIKKQPNVYDIDKVVEELEKIRAKETCNKEKCDTKEICRICVVDDAIEIVKQGGVSDDVCEWKSDYRYVSDKYKRETSCGHTFYDLHHARPFKYCPYCGEKIKVVE